MLNSVWEEPIVIEEFDYEDSAPAPYTAPSDSVKSADDALVMCINALGCVNLTWMSEASGLSIDALTDELGESEAIFQLPDAYDAHHDPATDWVLCSQYLCGNIGDKLKTAERLNQKYHGRFSENVRALKAVLPECVPFEEIGCRIGSPWITPIEYALFAQETFRLSAAPEITHSLSLDTWKVTMRALPYSHDSVSITAIYGTGRINALAIFEHSLNGSIVEVKNRVPRPDRACGYAYVIDKDETLLAQEKQQAQEKAFLSWCAADPARKQRIEERYNDTFVRRAVESYNGSFLRLADLNPEVCLYPHQRNAVARIVLTDVSILCWTVGSGKTFAMIAGLHELYRIGLSKKNLAVVPNVMIGFFEASHRRLYPDDKILVVSPENFRPQNRRHVLEQIRDEDFTVVYIAFSSFDLIHMSRDYYLERKQKEAEEYAANARTASQKWEKDRLEKLYRRARKEYVKLEEELPADEYPPFDSLGITALAIDELHNFKNISIQTNVKHLTGFHTKGSRKCNEMLEKVHYVRSMDGRLICSTGTPLTNSIADLYTLQKFLQPELLDALSLSSFDEWRRTFVTMETGFEVDVDSQNFRTITRPSGFHNLPELSALFGEVCDFYNGSESGMGLPVCDGYEDVTVPKTDAQCEYLDLLSLRTEMVREKLVTAEEDNLLNITHDSRALALDIRLADPDASPDPKSTKTYACAEKVFALYIKYPGTSQLVFCDLGVPKKAFNIYDTLKSHLIDLGIPKEEIACIQDFKTDAQRRRLFTAVNSAAVRVLIGSTSGLGTGVNIQNHLIAVHHLDVPWRPSDLTQRDGRLIRRGNKNRRVFRFRYITAGTFDAYSWQLLENKQRFIGQFMSHALGEREARDLDDTVLTYAEIKALCVGNPLLKTRIDTANRLERVKISCRQREKELRRLNAVIRSAPSKKEDLQAKICKIREDLTFFEKKHVTMNRNERLAFGKRLLPALRANSLKNEDRDFCRLFGFQILIPAGMTFEKPYIILIGKSGIRYTVLRCTMPKPQAAYSGSNMSCCT